tara:strand:- start:132 stop:473 length:342 start_codon:yes stop_codon:yes gene_type:complete
MKKLLITLALFLTVLTSKAQEAFEGVWVTGSSNYETVIVSSKYKVLNILNYSFKDNSILNEKLLTQTDSTMTTSIYNSRNGYTVGLEYSVVDQNTLQIVFTGDLNTTIEMKRK